MLSWVCPTVYAAWKVNDWGQFVDDRERGAVVVRPAEVSGQVQGEEVRIGNEANL